MIDVAIIGCGITGAAAAYELSRYRLNTVVFERENDISLGTSKANSAIIHAGYDPEPGTLMARLNVEGAALAKTLCAKLDVPYQQIGSLVAAFSPEECLTLERLYRRGLANGVPQLRLLTGAEARAIEPQLSEAVVGALYAPTAAIVSPWEYTLALAETAVRNGVTLKRNAPVTDIRASDGGYTLTAGGTVYQARYILNAAGVQADAVHELVGAKEFSIHPNRGEYFLLDKSEGTRVSHVLFQCPTEAGKGVLVAPTVHGNLIVGPNAESVEREDTANTAEGLAYVAESARKSVPSVNLRESIRNFAGVRALTDIDDFLIAQSRTAPGLLNLAGIKSPGLSAAPAIAREAVKRLHALGLPLEEREGFLDTRRRIRFQELPPEEKAALIRGNPAYGRVICRCETITEGELLDALRTPIPPCSVDGVKRRCGAGMGRCQGGFCGPRVLELLAREGGVDPTAVMQDREGMYLLTGETKTGRCER